MWLDANGLQQDGRNDCETGTGIYQSFKLQRAVSLFILDSEFGIENSHVRFLLRRMLYRRSRLYPATLP